MEVEALSSEVDYERALKEVERLWNAPPGTPEGTLLDSLIEPVEAYEEEHYPIGSPKSS